MTAILFRGLTEGIQGENKNKKKNTPNPFPPPSPPPPPAPHPPTPLRNRAADAKANMLRSLLGWGTSYFGTKRISGTRKKANYVYFRLVRYELPNLIYLQQS